MATDNFKIIDPYENYEIQPQENANGVYGNDFLNSVKSLQVGFGSQVMRIDRQGMWLGAADFASAPFSVDMAGNMVATSLDLSGYLQVGQSLADIQALIGDISDIESDLGTITAGNLVGLTVTGGLIRTSSSGGRVEIDGSTDNIEIYDTGGTKRIELDNDELTFYNSSGAERGGITANTTEVYMTALNGGNLHLEALGSAYTIIFSVAGVIQGYFTNQGLNMSDNDILSCNSITGNGNTIDFSNSAEVTINEEFSPDVNNSHDLGEPANIWNDLYASDVNYSTLTVISDRRLKENIAETTYGLADVLKLKPVTFNYKATQIDENAPRHMKAKLNNPEKLARNIEKARRNIQKKAAIKHIGFIAQDVEKIMPELVRTGDNDMLSMQATELIPVLVKAIQELAAEVKQLKK